GRASETCGPREGACQGTNRPGRAKSSLSPGVLRTRPIERESNAAVPLRDKDSLVLEQRVVARRPGLSVRAAVEHPDVAELPDRAHALDHRAGENGVEGGGEQAAGAYA